MQGQKMHVEISASQMKMRNNEEVLGQRTEWE